MRLDTSDPMAVNEFVHDLSQAITKDMAEIKETQFDHSGEYRTASVNSGSKFAAEVVDVLVDRLGRLVVPHNDLWLHARTVKFEDGVLRQIIKKEPRYTGDQIAALVIYLESPEVS